MPRKLHYNPNSTCTVYGCRGERVCGSLYCQDHYDIYEIGDDAAATDSQGNIADEEAMDRRIARMREKLGRRYRSDSRGSRHSGLREYEFSLRGKAIVWRSL